MYTIGFLGGGQLARMSAMAAYRLGFKVAVYDAKLDSPAGMMTKLDFAGSIDDDAALSNFADACDIITLENEFINPDRLRFLKSLGKEVYPTPETIGLIQDKLTQKMTFEAAGLPVPRFLPVSDSDNYSDLKSVFGSEFILKSRKMGYDGYGNHFVRTEQDFLEGMKKLSSRHSAVMSEEVIRFSKELAVMVAINTHEVAVYPVVETIQENHICKFVLAPAEISKATESRILDTAVNAIRSVHGKGIFGVELFLTEANEIYINEIAPRPHNSGHYSIEGCVTSQFENHIRAILELPLGSTSLLKNCAVMVNTLGKADGEGRIFNYDEILFDSSVHLHFYGKSESRKGRKMGHLTKTGENIAGTRLELENLENKIKIGKP